MRLTVNVNYFNIIKKNGHWIIAESSILVGEEARKKVLEGRNSKKKKEVGVACEDLWEECQEPGLLEQKGAVYRGRWESTQGTAHTSES